MLLLCCAWEVFCCLAERLLQKTWNGSHNSSKPRQLIDVKPHLYHIRVWWTLLCLLKGQMAEALASLDMHVIETPPKFQLMLSHLIDFMEPEVAPQRFEELLRNAKDHLGQRWPLRTCKAKQVSEVQWKNYALQDPLIRMRLVLEPLTSTSLHS